MLVDSCWNSIFSSSSKALPSKIRVKSFNLLYEGPNKYSMIIFFIEFSWLPNFLDGFHDVYDYFKDNGSLDEKPRHFPLWLVEVSKILFSDR